MDFLIESQIKVYPTVGDFPATGAVKTLYIDESTSTTYYWTGSAYSEIRTEAKYEAIDVLNGTGSSQAKMTVCYLKTSSSSANTPEILLANANSEATSSKTIGLLLATLANGATGKLITSGEFDKFDTSAYNVGDRLWLATTDGQMTTTVPSAPNHAVFIGIVTRKQSNNGRILVAIQNGYELQELHNVSITTPTDGQALMYEAVTQLWKNKTIATGITIGTTAITSGTVGRVLFEGTGNVVQESANLFWDNTNGRLGIGLNNPQGATHIAVATGTPALILSDVGSPNTLPTLQFRRGPLSAYSLQIDFPSNNKARLQIGDAVTGYELTGGNVALTGGRSIEFGGVTGQIATGIIGSVQTDNNNGQLTFSTRGSGTTAERMRIFNDGNIGINTSTNAGFKLDVNGTARIAGTNYQVVLQTTNNGIIKAQGGYQNGDGSYTADGNLFLKAGIGGSGNLYITPNNGNVSAFGLFANGTGFNIGLGLSTVASASFQINSTTQGFLPPRMTTTQKNAIASPASGLVVYDSTLNKLCVRTASAWETITSL